MFFLFWFINCGLAICPGDNCVVIFRRCRFISHCAHEDTQVKKQWYLRPYRRIIFASSCAGMLSSFELWTGPCMVPSEDEEIVYTIEGPSDNISLLLWIEWVYVHYWVSTSCVDVYLFNMLVFPLLNELQHVRPRVCSKVRTEIPRLRYIVKRKFDSCQPSTTSGTPSVSCRFI